MSLVTTTVAPVQWDYVHSAQLRNAFKMAVVLARRLHGVA